jgi:hypothetical protein
MASKLSVADVLERAADLIEPEGAWTQHAFSRNADGSVDRGGEEDDDGIADNPVCWCALGAIATAAGVDLSFSGFPNNGIVKDAASAFRAVEPYPVDWNDAPGRTQAEVVSKLREAAALAREQAA